MLLPAPSPSTLILILAPFLPCGIVTESLPEMDTFSGEMEISPEDELEDDMPPEEDELDDKSPPEEEELEEISPEEDELDEELPEEDELEDKAPEEDEELEKEPPEEDELELDVELLIGSIVHVELHPSPLLTFPSSHPSAVCLVPSPQITQSAEPKQVPEFVGQHPLIQQSAPHCAYVQSCGQDSSH